MRRTMVSDLIIVGAALIAVVHFVMLALDDGSCWVHPIFYANILRQSTVNGLGFEWGDFVTLFVQRAPEESRARLLNYLVMGWDQKLRLALYDHFLVHPSLMPITSFFYLIVSPPLFFAAAWTASRCKRAALATVAVYLGSVGFLSSFAMNFMSAKPLSMLGYIATIWLAGWIDRRSEDGRLLMETKGGAKYCLLAMLFLGFYVDETMFFAFLLPPILYPRRFFANLRTERWRMLLNFALYGVPVVIFTVTLVTAIPYMTKTYCGWTFNYFKSNANLSNQISYGAEYPADMKPGVKFITWAFFANGKRLLETSLLSWPYTVAIFNGPPGNGLYSLGPVPSLLSCVLFLGLIASQIALVRRSGPRGLWLRRLWTAAAFYVAYLTMLQLKHIPVVCGYNYGSTFTVLFSLILGETVHLLLDEGGKWRWVGPVLVVYVVLVQISNFHRLNHNWDMRHRGWAEARIEPGKPPFPRRVIDVDHHRDITRVEREAIWLAWKERRLDAYLREKNVPTHLVAMIFELDEIDYWRQKQATSR